MTRAERRERKRQRKKWESRWYRFGWHYGRKMKRVGEPPRPVLYALGVLLLPVALVVGGFWALLVKPALAVWRHFANPSY